MGHLLATGLMSGTSLDGTDLACCSFERTPQGWDYSILAAETIPYPGAIQNSLEEAFHWDEERIGALDTELGEYYGRIVADFHSRQGISPSLVASHGHTLFHRPEEGITRQLGDGRSLAMRSGCTVVNDFRVEDVAQGGQGAPLVPVGDKWLFSEYGACLNLGGFSNISYDDAAACRVAFDVCPVNLVLNHVARKRGRPYDPEGAMAASGTPDMSLVTHLNKLEYYQRDPPKSLGKEWLEEHYMPLLQDWKGSPEDLMASLVEHMAQQLAAAIRYAGDPRVLVSGGGALNQSLVRRLKHYSRAEIVIPGTTLIHYREALIFAFLGVLRIRGEVNCLSSVTGGRRNLSAGKVHTTKTIQP